VLPASVAGDVDRLARFQREAEVLAALNHPNIAAIYGLKKTSDLTALVMELVEGDDLSQRIARGAIALDEAVPIAKQITFTGCDLSWSRACRRQSETSSPAEDTRSPCRARSRTWSAAARA
jgi:serine/threonine protein kinase